MKRIVVMCAALVLTSCAAPPESGGAEVASLSTPVGTSSSAAPEEQRPRERLDMTEEDRDALVAPYLRCLTDHGVDKKADPPPSREVTDRANKACEPKRPLPAWELDATNPEALDFANRVVQCLRQKGVRYVEVYQEPGSEVIGPSYGGPNNDQESITLGLRYTKECEIEASRK
ncbi:hypothetical protein [Lentzea sp. E54]|uniref:hypothetical protein n=1 Tax=Lentzea xerophila TaxID=3435883 RepID=UPI003DA4F7FF